MFLTERYERLNALAQINSASTYLEIGVFQGETLKKVNVPLKIAVDPKFMFDYQSITNPSSRFYQLTSDIFFDQKAGEYESFDLIYLDGLHSFEQTYRDFLNSIKFSNEKTIWLIDDTCPVSWLSSLRNHKLVKIIYGLLNAKNRTWMGDVFKTIFAIHDQHLEMNYATFTGHGQTAIWFEERESLVKVDGLIKPIDKLSYSDFEQHKEVYMNMASSEEIIKRVKRSRQWI